MKNQEFKSFEDYNPKDRPTLHYIFTYPVCGLPLQSFMDNIIELQSVLPHCRIEVEVLRSW